MASQNRQYYINEAYNYIQKARNDLAILRGNNWPEGSKFNDHDLVAAAAALLRDTSDLQSNPSNKLIAAPLIK